MLIGSKLPPLKVETTYFNSGRAAFAFLVDEIIRPKKVYLPTFTCWSLVSTMERRFPHIELEFYPVFRDLTCKYPMMLEKDQLLVFIHYFGHENRSALPPSEGTILEDLSHSYMSQIQTRGDYIFGSYRKIMKVADGGFVQGFYNPIYEETQKLDTWLRLEAQEWRDMREAENMLDRDWQIGDISSQALAILLTTNQSLVRKKRQANERFLAENLCVGKTLIEYRDQECPMLHNRLLPTKSERDLLRSYLAVKGIFTSIHWPTHELVHHQGSNIEDTLWLEEHIISFPVSQDYGLNDMEFICNCVEAWSHKGK